MWRCEKHKKGGWIVKLESNVQTTLYFYPGSFDLKLLQSTRQGDFASLQRGLNPLYSTEYKSALTTAKAFLSQTTNRFLKELLSYKELKSRCVNIFYKTVYHNCDTTQFKLMETRLLK